MKFMLNMLIILLATGFSKTTFSQTGFYDLRLVTQKVDCNNQKAYVDIEIKAADGSPDFHLASQNYRFSFDAKVVDNPKMVEELDVSGIIQDGANTSMYSPHSLVGTKGNLVSYNVVLQAGPGVLVKKDEWLPVGRLVFDIKNINEGFNIIWHEQRNPEFPKTIVIRKEQEQLYRVDEGNYRHENTSFKPFCSSAEDDRA